MTNFRSFGVEHIVERTKKFISNDNIIANIYRIEAYNSVKFEHFYIGFIDFVFNDKSMTNSTNFFQK